MYTCIEYTIHVYNIQTSTSTSTYIPKVIKFYPPKISLNKIKNDNLKNFVISRIMNLKEINKEKKK